MGTTQTLFSWEDIDELRKIMKIEAEFVIRLQDELESKKKGLEATKRLVALSQSLANWKRSTAWKNWKKYQDIDTRKAMRKRTMFGNMTWR